MKKIFTEKDFQGLFTKWFKKNGNTFAYELKVSPGKTLNFSKFECQQLPSLMRVRTETFHMKLTDASAGLKPFDGFGFKKEKAYVGIMFEKNKQQDTAYLVDVKKVMALKNSGAKSISLAFAKEKGKEIILK